MQTVEEYSRRSLTRSEDKLLTISGIAEEYGKLLCDEQYLADLWRSDITQDLLWHVRESEYRRPPKYRALSWSWASVDGPIRFERIRKEPMPKVCDAQTKLVFDFAPFRAVSSRHIKARGRMKQVRWVKGLRHFCKLKYPSLKDHEDLGIFFIADTVDCIPASNSDGPAVVWCLEVGRYPHSSRYIDEGMLLAPVDHGRFRRIDLSRTEVSSGFDASICIKQGSGECSK